jgi:phospholipid/cholesterol/gamma-HCH transport system substrate-binding protein
LKKLKISNETLVGALAAIAIVVLILGFNFLKGEEVFSTTTNYYVRYENASGLQNSASVLNQGVKVGSVRRVTLSKNGQGVDVQFYVNDKVKVTKGSIARLISTDLFGTKALNIVVVPGDEYLGRNDTLLGTVEPSPLEALGTDLNPLREKAEHLITGIDTLVSALETERIKAILANIENTSAALNEMVSAENSKLNRMLANVESITSNLKANNALINAALTNVHAITDSIAKSELTSTIATAKVVMDKTNAIMQKINQGEGSLGLLVNDKALYNNLNQTAIDLDKLLLNLKKNPKRYVHFSVFGKKEKEEEIENTVK